MFNVSSHGVLVNYDIFFRCLRCCFEVSSQGKISSSPETLFSLVKPIENPIEILQHSRKDFSFGLFFKGSLSFPRISYGGINVTFYSILHTDDDIAGSFLFCFPKWEYSSINLLIYVTMFSCHDDSERAFFWRAVRELKQANTVKSCWNTPQQ